MPDTDTADVVLDLRDIAVERDDKRILDNVSWRIRRGEHWAIIGANGSGKTSLLKVAQGALWPTHGTAHVLDGRLGAVDLRELRRAIGWVSSAALEMLPTSDSALAVVASGFYASFHLYQQPPESAWQAAGVHLEALGCADLAGRRYGVLSQGEKQKVMLARALMAEPALLILDEPCTGLDLHARENLLTALEALARKPGGPTLVFVTHHIEELFPAISHALILQNGRVLASGPKEQALTGPVLSEAFSLPLTVDVVAERFWPRIESHRD